MIEIKRLARLAGDDQVDRFRVVIVELIILHSLVDLWHRIVDGISDPRASLQPMGKDAGSHREVIDLDLVHLGHVQIIPGWKQIVGIIGLSEEPCRAPFTHHIALLKWSRQHHKGKHWSLWWSHPDQLGSEIGKVLGTGRFQLSRWTDLVGGVSRHHLIDRSGVVEQALGRVTHRANHRHLVIDLGEPREQLGEVNSRYLRRDGVKHTLDVIGYVFLRIPQIDVTRSPLQVDHDDALRLGPPWGTIDHLPGHRLQLKDRTQCQTEESSTADSHQISAIDLSGITEVGTIISWYS